MRSKDKIFGAKGFVFDGARQFYSAIALLISTKPHTL
jgi:hypothetical protein